MPKCQYYLNLNKKPGKFTPKTNPIENCQKQFCQKTLKKPSKKSSFHGFSYIMPTLPTFQTFINIHGVFGIEIVFIHQLTDALGILTFQIIIVHQVVNLLLIDGIIRSEKRIILKNIVQFLIGRRGRNRRWFGLGRGGDEVRSY